MGTRQPNAAPKSVAVEAGKTFQSKRHRAVRVEQRGWAGEVVEALGLVLLVEAAPCPSRGGVFGHCGGVFSVLA